MELCKHKHQLASGCSEAVASLQSAGDAGVGGCAPEMPPPKRVCLCNGTLPRQGEGCLTPSATCPDTRHVLPPFVRPLYAESQSLAFSESRWLHATSNYFHSGSPKHLKESFKLEFRIKGNTANRRVVNMPKNRKVISMSAVVAVAGQHNVSISFCFYVYFSRLHVL